MHTFENFQSSRRYVASTAEIAGLDPEVDEAPPGYVYLDSCFIEITDNGFSVHIANSEREFSHLDAAERYLWEEWASTECA